jgi:hypothetical protein
MNHSLGGQRGPLCQYALANGTLCSPVGAKGGPLQIKQNVFCKLWKILSFGIDLLDMIGSTSHLHKTNKDGIGHQI